MIFVLFVAVRVIRINNIQAFRPHSFHSFIMPSNIPAEANPDLSSEEPPEFA
jgi:hypothetical protein